MPRRSLHLPRFLRFGPFHSPEQPQREPGNITGSPPSSHPSSRLASRQARGLGADPVAAARNIPSVSAGRITHDSQPVAALVKSNSAQALGSRSSVALPSINAVPPSQTTDTDPSQHQDLLLVPRWSPATASHASLLSQQSTPSPRQDGKSGMIYVQNTHESRNVSVQGDGNNVNYTNTFVNSTDIFMEKLLEKTILGAAHDSSARDPPPRCHPGTRLAILARCLEFITNADGARKIRWVVGKAGVGKSAIMQNVADSSFSSESPGASIFFSINGRNDGAKAIITLAYQLAASCVPYRALIEYEITRKPSLLQASVSVQFKKFVIEPFIHHPQLKPLGRVLIVIDGLDECDKTHTQREFLHLISDFCLTYPSSPIVWIIASRPEPHITSFFAQRHVKAVYEKEEILVDSDEARDDVERFLRNELAKIQEEFSLDSRSQWPLEQDLWKLADASGGLFVFADTVIKYIGDRTFGNPTSQLNDVLKAIDAHPLPNVTQDEHPMARLDALYAQILSKVPERIMVNTRKILLALAFISKSPSNLQVTSFLMLCNWLGMTCDDAYAAIRHLLSVLDAPPRDEADQRMIRSFHKSFIDYISDFTRSGFSYDIEREAYQLGVECTFRILGPTPGGIDVGDKDLVISSPSATEVGFLTPGSGTGTTVLLSWPIGEETNYRTKLGMYKLAVANVVEGIRKAESAFCTEFCIRLITSQFQFYLMHVFPYRELQSLVFGRSRRRVFVKHGISDQLPAKLLHSNNFIRSSRLQFRRPTTTATNLSGPWNPSCKHNRAGYWGEGKDEDWTTEFEIARASPYSGCDSCRLRLEQQFENLRTRSPDHVVTVLFTSTPVSFVEFQFIDPDDGVSEWTYWLVYLIEGEERRKLRSCV